MMCRIEIQSDEWLMIGLIEFIKLSSFISVKVDAVMVVFYALSERSLCVSIHNNDIYSKSIIRIHLDSVFI